MGPGWAGEKVSEVIEQVRPALQDHGGDVELLGVDEDKTVRVRLQGACRGCPGATMTMRMGIERILKEREELSKAAAERIIVEIIEPVENLDRALEAAKAAKNLKKLRDGVAMTRDQIWSVLERNGLKRVETAGCAFDPRWHEAVEQVSDDEADDGTVKGEIRSGYVLNGKVLRCAKVKVSKKSTVEIRE